MIAVVVSFEVLFRCVVLVTYVGYLSLIVLKLVFYRMDTFPQEAYLHL